MALVRQAWMAGARWYDRLERVVILLLVTGIVFLSLAQILLRNFFRTGWPWAEPLLGVGLLWLTMLGALAATGQCRHITIDLASHLLPRRMRGGLRRLTTGFAMLLCGVLAWAAWRYLLFFREMDNPPILGQAAWKFYLVMPVCFALMAWRFMLQTFFPWSWQPRMDEAPAAPEGSV